jgi:SAM-dependent methyltransferase
MTDGGREEAGRPAGRDSADDALKLQYESYPYPPRDPADEARRLVTGSPSQLAELNHYLFAGKRDFSRPFRALVAGGGTGDAAIMLAQQLADAGSGGEVVYLDLSRASAAIATARAKARGLRNIRFLDGSIMEADRLAPGPFDYIDCCGVLHHMPDPAAGLRALEGVLAADGGMGLMVYAPLGRTGVYDVQAMLRMVQPAGAPAERVATARRMLKALPPTNRLKRNPFVADHVAQGDAGIYDLLLHSRDRAYTVPEVAALADAAALRIVAFIEPVRYDPAAWLDDPDLASRVAQLSWIERCAFAELLTGNLKTHVFYVVKAANEADTVARPGQGSAVPVPVGFDATAGRPAGGGALRVNLDGLKLTCALTDMDRSILSRMDGRRTIEAIYADMAATEGAPDRAAFDAAFARLFGALNGLNLVFLRAG